MQAFYPHLPSYTQAYTRLFKLLPLLSLLYQRKRKPRWVLVDSEPLPVCRWSRRHRCAVVSAWERYSKAGAFYGFRLQAWVSTCGEVLPYALRPANQHDYRVAQSLLPQSAFLGYPIRIGDKAFASEHFVTPPKKNSKRHSRWKPDYSKMPKRVETVFSQLVSAHIRISQVQTLKALEVRTALTILVHNLKLWGITP
jgi:hypothetical protein